MAIFFAVYILIWKPNDARAVKTNIQKSENKPIYNGSGEIPNANCRVKKIKRFREIVIFTHTKKKIYIYAYV